MAAAAEARSGTVTQLEAATTDGSVFVVRDGDSYIAATTRPEPTVALVFYDLKTALRASRACPARRRSRRGGGGRRRRRRTAMRRRLLAVLALLAGWLVGLALYRRTAATRRGRVDLYFEDGDAERRRRDARSGAPAPARPGGPGRRAVWMTRGELAAAIRRHAYLEGDFVLRSGKRSQFYLDKYRFETRPDLLRALGREIAAVREHGPMRCCWRGRNWEPSRWPPRPRSRPTCRS